MNHKNILIFLLFCILTACAGNEYGKPQNDFNVGKMLEETQHYDSATLYYRKAINLSDNKNDDKLKGELYNGVGNVFSKARLYPEAFHSYKEAKKYNSRLTDKTNFSLSLRGMDKSFTLRHNPDSDVNYFLKASELSPFVKDTTKLLLTNNNLSVVCQTLGQHDKALRYNDVALRLSNESTILCRILLIRGDIFMRLRQYDSARYYYEAGIHSQILQTKSFCYWMLYKLYATLKLYDSNQYFKLFTFLNDSLDRSSQTFQVKSVEKKHLKNKAENKYNRLLLYLFSLSLLFIFLFTWFIIKLHKQKNIIHKYQEMFVFKQASGSVDMLEEKIIEHVQKCQKLEEIQNSIIESMKTSANYCTEYFKKTNEYKLMRGKLKNDSSKLNKKEIEDIFKTVIQAYEPFITHLSHYIPVTIDDSYLCCLSLCSLSSQESSVLRNVSQASIRSQKRRIKNKFAKALPTSELFKFIFEKKKKHI